VLNSPQPGQRPNQRAVEVPHSEHEKRTAGFALATRPLYGRLRRTL
jgi:hypothetical protein